MILRPLSEGPPYSMLTTQDYSSLLNNNNNTFKENNLVFYMLKIICDQTDGGKNTLVLRI